MPPHNRGMVLVWWNLENSQIYCVYGFATAIYDGLLSLLTGGKCQLTSILLNLKIIKKKKEIRGNKRTTVNVTITKSQSRLDEGVIPKY